MRELFSAHSPSPVEPVAHRRSESVAKPTLLAIQAEGHSQMRARGSAGDGGERQRVLAGGTR